MPLWVGSKNYPHRLNLACFRGKTGFWVISVPYNA